MILHHQAILKAHSDYVKQDHVRSNYIQLDCWDFCSYGY